MDSVDKLLINGLKAKALYSMKNHLTDSESYYKYTNELKRFISDEEYTYVMRCLNPCLTCSRQNKSNDDFCYEHCVGHNGLYYTSNVKDFNWKEEFNKFEESLK